MKFVIGVCQNVANSEKQIFCCAVYLRNLNWKLVFLDAVVHLVDYLFFLLGPRGYTAVYF